MKHLNATIWFLLALSVVGLLHSIYHLYSQGDIAIVGSQGVLLVSPSEVQLGQINGGDRVEFQIAIRNLSNVIFDGLCVESSCGCTVWNELPSSIPPGEEHIISASLVAGKTPGRIKTAILIKGGQDLSDGGVIVPVVADVN